MNQALEKKSAVDGILAQGENSAVEFKSARVRPDGPGRGIPPIIRAMGKAAVWAEEGELLRLSLFLG